MIPKEELTKYNVSKATIQEEEIFSNLMYLFFSDKLKDSEELLTYNYKVLLTDLKAYIKIRKRYDEDKTLA